MYVKIILAVNVGVLMVRADRTMTDIRVDLSHLPSSSNISQFFNKWRLNSEKIEGIADNSDSYSPAESENRQKRKEIESKLTALQNLYDDRNWEPLEDEQFFTHAERNARQMSAPLYDSLLTRRTFVPSLKTILIELSLMTLSIVAVNAIENAMAQTKKPPQKVIKKPNLKPGHKPVHHRSYSDHIDYISSKAIH